MASGSPVAAMVELGNDITAIKMYGIGVIALWGYDYFLTLEDEVEFGWKMKNTLVFALFIIARYLPVPFLLWIFASSWIPSYTAKLCSRTASLEVIYFTFITLLAHIVLTLRVYAVTGKNKWIAGGLYGLTILQLGVGLYLCVYSSLHYLHLPPLNLDSYRVCIFQLPISVTVLYTSLSLGFDLAAFLIVLVQTRVLKKQYRDPNITTIADTVTRDTEVYFLLIFSSHLLLVLMMIFMKQLLHFLPAVGNAVFVPMMITRIILSLKKAASEPPTFEMTRILGSPLPAQSDDCTAISV